MNASENENTDDPLESLPPAELFADGLLREFARGGPGDDDEFVDRIRVACEEGDGKKAPPPRPAPSARRPRPALLGIAAGLLVGLLTFTVFMIPRPRDKEPGKKDVATQEANRGEPERGTVADQPPPESEASAPAGLGEPDQIVESDKPVVLAVLASLTPTIGGKDRYLTHLSTDKPIYRPGETVYVRAVLLHAATRRPLAAGASSYGVVKISDPKGATAATGAMVTQDSVAGFSWKIPTEQPGGQYKIQATAMQGNAPSERTFEIRSYRAPRLKSQIVFLRDGYGPGDTVQATLHVDRAEGGVPAGARVTIVARVDGVEAYKGKSQVDARGNCEALFKLPATIERGEGTLAFITEDGGTVETATKTIPILLQTVDLALYPEGGDLIAGLLNRVYFEARTPARKPADISGLVVDEKGDTVGRFRSEHEGRGRFALTPAKGGTYFLRITKPSGIAKRFPLPKVRDAGVVLSAVENRTLRRRVVRVRVASTVGRTLTVTLSQREREVAGSKYEAQPGNVTELRLLPPDTAAGVLIATVWDADGTPLAERLVYREPSMRMHVEITANRTSHVPGDKVRLTVKTTDEAGRPVGAMVGVTVTDDSVLEMIEKREQAPRLPVMVLLEKDVRELADAHVYLDARNKQAPLALDLLLGTQGWRRFAFIDAPAFIRRHRAAARRVLALRVPAQPIQPFRTRLGAGFRGGCFVAGTLVMTDSGPQPIETIQAGTHVRAHNPKTGEWELKPVIVPLRHDYEGDVVTIQAGEFTVEATGNHPFWVVRGELLAGRPTVQDISAQEREFTNDGRWVEARDLRIGDVLRAFNGGTLGVTRLSFRHESLKVYNITVAGLHTYGVSAAGILVHNKVASAAPELKKDLFHHNFVVKDPALRRPAWELRPVGEPMAEGEGEAKGDQLRQGRFAIMVWPEAEPLHRDRHGQAEMLLEALQDELVADLAERQGAGPVLGDIPRLGWLFLPSTNQALRVLTYVRVYAHQVRANRKPNDRVDFAETLYWSAGIKTDAKTGEASVALGLSDAVTSFRVFADAFTSDGVLGQGTGMIQSVEPFYLEPKLPLEITQGDIVELPVAIVNACGETLSGVKLDARVTAGMEIDSPAPFQVESGGRVRRILRLRAGKFVGEGTVTISAKTGPYADTNRRTLVVKPMGFPIEIGSGGVIGPGEAVVKTIVIPKGMVLSSLNTKIVVYPTPLANMTEALERLIREPSGCFEQASSTTYPLVMAQQYFLSHQGVDPALIKRSAKLLDKGYKRLIGFECKKKGYEWFASDPGHEALTAYGLLEFTDMAKVRQVDTGMMNRTRRWLLGRRDGEGGFTRQRRALHTWIVDKDCSNAYITWALLESGETGLEKEIAWLKTAAQRSKNSYVLALVANVMHRAGETAAAKTLRARLAERQTDGGDVDGATTSIVGSGGMALRIETASLAALAWLADPAYAANVEKAVKFLSDSCKGGRYGSTQSTVLALRAIVAYDRARARPRHDGALRLFVNGRAAGGAVRFSKDTHGALQLMDIKELLEDPGRHTVELRMEDGSPMPYSLAVTYNTVTPVSSDECKVRVHVSLGDAEIREGAVTEVVVTVTNKSGEHLPTPVAIIGLPGGLEPRHDQLKELVKAGTIAAYEVIGREVVLYWRDMAANAKVRVPISLVAAVPGTYTGPASRAYLYYTDEFKHWADGLKVKITPR